MKSNTKVKKQKTNINKKGIGLTVGAVAGSVIGVVAVAALSNKDTRKKVVDTVNTLKDEALDTVDRMKQESKTLEEVATDKVTEKIQKIKNNLPSPSKKTTKK